ncbi:MAG: lysozyme inhibitor LprI family protein [Gammaproteobacteria bacterium]
MNKLIFAVLMTVAISFGQDVHEARDKDPVVSLSAQHIPAVRETKPHAPTEKDLADCTAVMDGEGHGPDPGSTEWWAACERLRVKGRAPSFDCSKTAGQVEESICSDPKLAALDVDLARLYAAASAKADGQELKTLRAYQRGWIKGRNECWKAIGVSMRECVEASYRKRIGELRSQLLLTK